MKLIIVHFHFRPGGVRRVIELATPFLLRAMPSITRVVLAAGEARDTTWNAEFRNRVEPTPLELSIEPAFGYISEQASSPTLAQRIRLALERLLAGSEAALVWAHNLSVGRNVVLARELVRACSSREKMLLLHHHDWWFDNRWRRWPEMRRSGVLTLREAARVIFPINPLVRFVTINSADASVLRRHFGKRVAWLANLAERSPEPSAVRIHAAREWLRGVVGDDSPVWLLPCRLLRRKNVAEALLLTRWLRPEATLVTTEGVSSEDERDYAKMLAAAAREHRWRVHFGVLANDKASKPSVRELLAVSECVLMTSLQEGFGFPYLEAADAERPLIARRLPNIMPDFAKFGFRFAQTYDEVLVPPSLFMWKEEYARQHRLFREWRSNLPHECRGWVEPPTLLTHEIPKPIPFSRLTLVAQIEILAQPVAESWAACAPLNPFLRTWKSRASKGELRITSWPTSAETWLNGRSYARRLAALSRGRSQHHSSSDQVFAAQDEFLRTKLTCTALFPLVLTGR